ncbi:hypothetical protein ACI75Y_07300 [Capnocytophaga stomatis]|uniref:hypothetical protein n=1 Tax=Capnocytophaga stomatis TaxID=1848904 RepID=UPI00385DC33C
MEKIFLKEVLSQMRKLDEAKNPIPFSLGVRTFNKQNGYGGKLVVYPNAVLMQQPKNKKDFERDPHHWENRTRNIKLQNGEIKKINILFITHFNGKEVIY